MIKTQKWKKFPVDLKIPKQKISGELKIRTKIKGKMDLKNQILEETRQINMKTTKYCIENRQENNGEDEIKRVHGEMFRKQEFEKWI